MVFTAINNLYSKFSGYFAKIPLYLDDWFIISEVIEGTGDKLHIEWN